MPFEKALATPILDECEGIPPKAAEIRQVAMHAEIRQMDAKIAKAGLCTGQIMGEGGRSFDAIFFPFFPLAGYLKKVFDP